MPAWWATANRGSTRKWRGPHRDHPTDAHRPGSARHQRHFYRMSALQYSFVAHIPTISGIDIALWDLAGEILDKPLYRLLGGPMRAAAPAYSRTGNIGTCWMPASAVPGRSASSRSPKPSPPSDSVSRKIQKISKMLEMHWDGGCPSCDNESRTREDFSTRSGLS